jgi:hypothetical protein
MAKDCRAYPLLAMSQLGHLRRFEAVGDESGFPPIPDVSPQRSEPTLRAKTGNAGIPQFPPALLSN